MAITWFRTRKPGRHATGHATAPSADRTDPAGQQTALGSPVAYDASYDHPGWDEAERELLMPVTAAGGGRPPWETGTALAALRGAGPEEPDLAELTLTDKPLGVLRPETPPERAEAAPAGAGAPQDRPRPYVPQDGGLPSAWLRAISHSGSGSTVLETLTGTPFYAGTRHGTRAEGICLGAADDIWLILDTESDEVLDALEASVRQARASRAPVVPADPDAAEHREALEGELDDSLEQARGVLQAAGNLGFLSAALKRRDGEGCMDLFVTRAALHHAVDRGDGAAAGEASSALVDIISELCGDEIACSIANGEVPSEVAVARTGEAPEPEAADEPGDDGIEDGPADGQDGPVAA